MPNVDLKCQNPNGVSWIQDCGVASTDLASFFQLEPIYNHLFELHVVGVKVSVHVQADVDARVIPKVLRELPIVLGPREAGLLPCDSSALGERSRSCQCERWPKAAQSFLISGYIEGIEDEAFVDRGSSIVFEEAAGEPTACTDHTYAMFLVCFLECLGLSITRFDTKGQV